MYYDAKKYYDRLADVKKNNRRILNHEEQNYLNDNSQLFKNLAAALKRARASQKDKDVRKVYKYFKQAG